MGGGGAGVNLEELVAPLGTYHDIELYLLEVIYCGEEGEYKIGCFFFLHVSFPINEKK